MKSLDEIKYIISPPVKDNNTKLDKVLTYSRRLPYLKSLDPLIL